MATQVAQTLSTCLNGEGTNPEIFISRLALDANRVARGDHQRIYHVHHSFIEDIVFLPFWLLNLLILLLLNTPTMESKLNAPLDSGQKALQTLNVHRLKLIWKREPLMVMLP